MSGRADLVGRLPVTILMASALMGSAGCGPDTSRPPAPVPETTTDADPARTSPSFEDAASRLGVEFVYRNGAEAGHRAVPEFVGGGVGLLDFDADGRLDLLFAGGGEFLGRALAGRPAGLYRDEGRYMDRAAAAGLGAGDVYSHAVCAADYDGDGFRDVLVTGWGGVRLHRNQGDGTFVEDSAAAGLTDPTWTSSGAWGDFDGDGHLDLALVRYLDWSFENHPECLGAGGRRDVCGPNSFGPLPDSLYLSNGDGSFRDATAEWGLRDDGKGLGAVVADLDGDGDLDLYVANDNTANFLYRNDRGRFTEVGLESGAGYDAVGAPDGSMGVDVGDFDGDGGLDIWVANYEREACALYRAVADLSYLHASELTGVAAEAGLFVGWGTGFLDFDLDSDLDLFVVNGHADYFPRASQRDQRPLLFENLDGRRFKNVAPGAGRYFATSHVGRGAACGDVDRDGRPDLVVSHVGAPAAVLLNRTPGGRSLSLRLVGQRSPREPIGAVVTVDDGSGRRVYPLKGGGSYLSSSEDRLVIGLGRADRPRSVTVRWPSGTVEAFPSPSAGQRVLLVEGRGRWMADPDPKRPTGSTEKSARPR